MTADAVGGVWTYSLELARALQPHGVEIVLATMGPRPSAAQRNEVAALGNVQLFEGDFALEWMDEPWADVDAAGDWLLAHAARVQPDVIHLNGYAHATLPWEAPVLVAAHSCVLSWWRAVKREAPPPRYAEYQRRIEAGLQAADLILAPTAAMLAGLDEHYRAFTPRKVIPNCRDGTLFAPSAKQPFIFSAGRLWDEAKNIALLGTIAPDLTWPIRIAGPQTGTGSQPVSGSAGCESARCSHLGTLPPAILARHLSAAAVYAAPARYEPFGLGILEAALSGCALVLGDIPSLRELWSDAALFAPPDDPVAWTTTLHQLASDDPLRDDLARRARERALQFTPATTAAAYLEAYAALAQQPAREELAA